MMKALNVLITVLVLGAAAAGGYAAWNRGWLAGGAGEASSGDDHHGHAHGHGHGGHEDEFERGPHGGRLLEDGDFTLELSIFEEGMPPQYRVYAYHDGEPVPPGEVELAVELARLGRTDVITFVPEGTYLRGEQVVEEPHSFDVTVSGRWGDHELDFAFESHEGRVELSPEAMEFAQLGTAIAGPATLRRTISLPGEVKLNADALVHITARVSGIARSVHSNLGDSVGDGDLLAVLDSRELADAKSTFLAATERLRLAEIRFEREKDLVARKVSSQEDFLSAETALAEARIDARAAQQKLHALGATTESANAAGSESAGLTAHEVRSPIGGVILDKHIVVGEAIEAGTSLFLIADLSTIWVEVTVYAQDLGRVRPGSPVTIHSDEIGATAEGTVAYVGSLVGLESRSAKAIVKLDNPDRLWRPGLFVTVEVLDEQFEVPLAVAEEGLQTFRDWDVVFAKYGNVFEIRPLQLGRRAGGYIEVLGGIEPGQEYVTANSYVIKADIEKYGATHDH
jgi:cobalt-zinc-cadmium efflux system membrane fusion protein